MQLWKRRLREWQGFPVMPGAFPLVGHLPQVATNYLGAIRRAESGLGPYFWVNFGFGSQLLLCLAPDAVSILKNKITSSAHFEELMPGLVSGSVFVQDGPTHRRMRSAMNGSFQPRGLSVADIGSLTADLIAARVKSWHARRRIKLLVETRQLALAVIFRIMGVPENELTLWRKKYEALLLLALNIPAWIPGSPTRRGLRARAWLDERLIDLVRQARAQPETRGLVAALANARDENGERLSHQELADNLRILLLAGHETTSSTMAWMTIKLAQRPDIWQALCDEAKAGGEVPRTPQELKEFPVAEAVFREALRLHPPTIINSRQALEDFELAGRTVSAGTRVGVSLVHLSRDAARYEKPDEFLPERWLERKESITPMEMLQFGGGPHFCIGYHLAWMKLVQFAVTLATEMGRRGLRPRLIGRSPRPRYLPVQHPPVSTRIVFS